MKIENKPIIFIVRFIESDDYFFVLMPDLKFISAVSNFVEAKCFGAFMMEVVPKSMSL